MLLLDGSTRVCQRAVRMEELSVWPGHHGQVPASSHLLRFEGWGIKSHMVLFTGWSTCWAAVGWLHVSFIP